MSEKKRILIVEDDHQLREVITKKLESKGFDCTPVSSVEEAKEALVGSDFQAVWLDHYLGGENIGLDLLRGMREEAKTKGIPVFLVSHTATEDKLDEYRKLGIADYFYKLTADLGKIVDSIASRL